MSKFGLASLFQVTNKKLNITSAMPYSIFLLVGIVVATWLILRHTMLGRGIYACLLYTSAHDRQINIIESNDR